ncbi:MAG: hypothetical protein QW101_07490 [Ignisphaera sp.]
MKKGGRSMSVRVKSTKITVYLKPHIKSKLEEIAKKEHKKISEYIRDIVLEKINQ